MTRAYYRRGPIRRLRHWWRETPPPDGFTVAVIGLVLVVLAVLLFLVLV